MKYRSRNDIVSQILQSANGGITKTKIMYQAYLSFAQLKEYLGVLSASGLIEYSPADRLYRTTPKGMNFVTMYEKIGLLSDFTAGQPAGAIAPKLRLQ